MRKSDQTDPVGNPQNAKDKYYIKGEYAADNNWFIWLKLISSDGSTVDSLYNSSEKKFDSLLSPLVDSINQKVCNIKEDTNLEEINSLIKEGNCKGAKDKVSRIPLTEDQRNKYNKEVECCEIKKALELEKAEAFYALKKLPSTYCVLIKPKMDSLAKAIKQEAKDHAKLNQGTGSIYFKTDYQVKFFKEEILNQDWMVNIVEAGNYSFDKNSERYFFTAYTKAEILDCNDLEIIMYLPQIKTVQITCQNFDANSPQSQCGDCNTIKDKLKVWNANIQIITQ